MKRKSVYFERHIHVSISPCLKSNSAETGDSSQFFVDVYEKFYDMLTWNSSILELNFIIFYLPAIFKNSIDRSKTFRTLVAEYRSLRWIHFWCVNYYKNYTLELKFGNAFFGTMSDIHWVGIFTHFILVKMIPIFYFDRTVNKNVFSS